MIRQVYEGLLGRVPVGVTEAVTLVEVDDPAVEAISKLLYTVGYHPFSQIVLHVQTLSRQEICELLEMAFEKRGRHDDWLSEFRVGYLNFDIVMDVGSFRDLHRHRRCQQYRQPFSTRLGFEVPEVIGACGAESIYRDALQQAFDVSERIDGAVAPMGVYPLPLGTRCPGLFSMDLADLPTSWRCEPGPPGTSPIAASLTKCTKRPCSVTDFAPFVRAVDPAYEDSTER